MKLEFSRQIFKKSSNIKFHKNQSSGSSIAPCRQMDGWTDRPKLTVTLFNFANTSKKCYTLSHHKYSWICHSLNQILITFNSFKNILSNWMTDKQFITPRSQLLTNIKAYIILQFLLCINVTHAWRWLNVKPNTKPHVFKKN